MAGGVAVAVADPVAQAGACARPWLLNDRLQDVIQSFVYEETNKERSLARSPAQKRDDDQSLQVQDERCAAASADACDVGGWAL